MGYRFYYSGVIIKELSQHSVANLVITWYFDMMSAYTRFMILLRSKEIMLMLLITQLI